MNTGSVGRGAEGYEEEPPHGGAAPSRQGDIHWTVTTMDAQHQACMFLMSCVCRSYEAWRLSFDVAQGRDGVGGAAP